jgi:putative transposase
VYISLCSMKKDIRRGRSVVYSLTVHLVFVTKYRRNAITDRVRDHLGGTLGEVCAKMGCTLREFDGEDDHVHLLVDYPPKLAISRLVNSLKLVSARFLRKRNFPEVRRKLWGVHFWTPSYYAGSCGGANLQTVKRYIQAQRIPSRWARADSA